MSAVIAAFQFLTVLPWPNRKQRPPEEIGKSSGFFPLVGLALGVILLVIDGLLQAWLPAPLLSIVLVCALVLLTRGLHLDGLADTFDGLGAGGRRERVLAVMDDSHCGVFGVIAIVVLILFKTRALEAMQNDTWRALLVAPLLARWAMALLAYHSLAAKPGLGATLMGHMRARHLWLATAITLGAVVGLLKIFGLALMAGVALLTLACKLYFHRRIGGLTGDTFGAVGEISETLVLVWLAAVQQ